MQVFGNSTGKTELLHRNGDTDDIIDGILYADAQSAQFVLPSADYLKGRTDKDTAKKIWEFLKNNVKYKADKAGREVIQSPAFLLKNKIGDCKSFSIALAALLRHFGIPYKYRFTAYVPGDVTHVYIIAKDRASGKWFPIDATIRQFDYEAPYLKKIDKSPIGGINGVGEVKTNWMGWAVLGGFVYWIFK